MRVVGRYVHGNGTRWSQLGAQPGDSVVLVVPVAKVGGATRASLLLDASVRRATVRENGTTLRVFHIARPVRAVLNDTLIEMAGHSFLPDPNRAAVPCEAFCF